jgi:hypothetical protein
VRRPHTLEGWAPEPKDGAELAEVIDLAFDYRGDVTIVMRDATERVGYLFNREGEVDEPFVQLLPPGMDDTLIIRYADIRTIRFTGKDTAAGRSYAAWLERRASPRAAEERDAGG